MNKTFCKDCEHCFTPRIHRMGSGFCPPTYTNMPSKCEHRLNGVRGKDTAMTKGIVCMPLCEKVNRDNECQLFSEREGPSFDEEWAKASVDGMKLGLIFVGGLASIMIYSFFQ